MVMSHYRELKKNINKRYGSGTMENSLCVDMSEQWTAISIIKNIFYVQNCEAQFLNSNEDTFEHPFNNQILLDTSLDRPSEEVIQQVLEVRKENQEIGKLSSDFFTVNEESVTCMALPFEIKSQLKDMFVKPRLTVALKSRGSGVVERKLSCTSSSSLKRNQAANKGGAKKPRKLSSISHESQLFDLQKTRGKRSSSDFHAEQKKNSTDTLVSNEIFSSQNRLSKSSINERSKIVSIVKDVPETDFVITSSHYNCFYELDQETEIGDEVKKNQFRMSTWSVQENARRKVAQWLRKSNAV